jgi:hypothetical protein
MVKERYSIFQLIPDKRRKAEREREERRSSYVYRQRLIVA